VKRKAREGRPASLAKHHPYTVPTARPRSSANLQLQPTPLTSFPTLRSPTGHPFPDRAIDDRHILHYGMAVNKGCPPFPPTPPFCSPGLSTPPSSSPLPGPAINSEKEKPPEKKKKIKPPPPSASRLWWSFQNQSPGKRLPRSCPLVRASNRFTSAHHVAKPFQRIRNYLG